VSSYGTIFSQFNGTSCKFCCKQLQCIRRNTFNQPVNPKALYIVDYLVGTVAMDVGTVVHYLKRGLYGSVRDLLLDIELFMANATRSSRHHTPGCLRAAEGGDLLLMDLEPLHRRRLRCGRR
jgi:hypothetical protein